ncbi:hypothetical protein ACMHYB_21865 [Sorangium sp. So ce1128]
MAMQTCRSFHRTAQNFQKINLIDALGRAGRITKGRTARATNAGWRSGMRVGSRAAAVEVIEIVRRTRRLGVGNHQNAHAPKCRDER